MSRRVEKNFSVDSTKGLKGRYLGKLYLLESVCKRCLEDGTWAEVDEKDVDLWGVVAAAVSWTWAEVLFNVQDGPDMEASVAYIL